MHFYREFHAQPFGLCVKMIFEIIKTFKCLSVYFERGFLIYSSLQNFHIVDVIKIQEYPEADEIL